jgi:hypothetical protein
MKVFKKTLLGMWQFACNKGEATDRASNVLNVKTVAYCLREMTLVND